MVAILYKQTQNTIWLLYYIYKHKTQYGCYITYTNTKRDMVAILYKQTQNVIWLLYYINKHKHDMVAILYKQTQNAIWLIYYYINKHKMRYGCYII